MEAGSAFCYGRFVGEIGATGFDCGLKIVDGVEVFVDGGLVNQFPKTLGGLELGAVGRQVE